jgi:hypothetical protein
MRHAGYLISILALTMSSPVCAQESGGSAEERFEKGVSLFKNDDFDAALVEFKAAYKLKSHFAVRYNIGITLYKLHRYEEAFEELQAYLFEGGGQVGDERRKEVVEILGELKSLVGVLEVNCGVEEAQLFVDGKEVDSWEMSLEVGEHSIEVRAPGYEPFTTTIELPGGSTLKVDAELVPEDDIETLPPVEADKGKRLGPAVFWTGLGLTAAVSVTAAVTGGLALKYRSDYRDMDYEDAWRSTRRKCHDLALTTDILLGVAGGLAITTIVVAFFTDFDGRERQSMSWSISPGANSLTVSVVRVF